MRKSGILLPVTSLPSPYGVGTMGKEARDFVDFLQAAAQRYWQILPIGPTGYGDSPYQSFSAFAGNPYLIDLPTLEAEGLLTAAELEESPLAAAGAGAIDYEALYHHRYPLLRKAAARFDFTQRAYLDFCAANPWLEDYTLFMAIKGTQEQRALSLWPEALRRREPAALAKAAAELAEERRFWAFVQYEFYAQWAALKAYANSRGVEIIGDIPIYVSPDSSDLWASPELFQLTETGEMSAVAGCPPDAFAADGQLWGNPLYDWDYHKRTGFAWWCQRLRHAATIYDVVRIDHFRGLAGYYSIPAGSATAAPGHWEVGPGADFVNAVKKNLPDVTIIAEDLGYLTQDVADLLAASGCPGMKVLQFAFDSRESGNYLPCNYQRNSVVYTGTHDNVTTKGWMEDAAPADVATACRYLVTTPEKLVRRLVIEALACVCDTAIVPMQDWLELGQEARINHPSTLGGNWCWRVDGATLTPALAAEIADLTRLYQRA